MDLLASLAHSLSLEIREAKERKMSSLGGEDQIRWLGTGGGPLTSSFGEVDVSLRAHLLSVCHLSEGFSVSFVLNQASAM